MPVAPVPLLFLIADTGGGHRSAARAVSQALERAFPGRFRPVLCDPLGGAGTPWPLRWVTSLYGPVTLRAPWLWGAAYHLVNSGPGMRVLHRLLLSQADGPAVAAARALRPAAVVSFHPLACLAAGAVRDQLPTAAVTVITDLSAPHAAWLTGQPDLIVGPATALQIPAPGPAPGHGATHRPGAIPRHRADHGHGSTHGHGATHGQGIAQGHGAAVGQSSAHSQGPTDGAASARIASQALAGPETAFAGPPVGREFWGGPVSGPERLLLRRSLGLTSPGAPSSRLLIVLAGGAEGCGGLARQAAAILRTSSQITLVAVCGRNQRLRRRLDRLSARQPDPGTLVVTGFCDQLAGLLRCADLVVTKAGPGTIAEAACCGTPLLLTSHLPGQERDNAAIVLRAGAGRRARGRRRLRAEISRLAADPAQLDHMRAAAARLGRPGDATRIAHLIAEAAGRYPPDRSALADAGRDRAGPDRADPIHADLNRAGPGPADPIHAGLNCAGHAPADPIHAGPNSAGPSPADPIHAGLNCAGPRLAGPDGAGPDGAVSTENEAGLDTDRLAGVRPAQGGPEPDRATGVRVAAR